MFSLSAFVRATLLLLCTLSLTLFVQSDLAAGILFSAGPPDETASDPPAFNSCVGCHVPNPLNSGDGSFGVQGIPAEYTPNTSYVLTIELEDPGQARWGFELTAVDRSHQAIGQFTQIDPGTQLSTQAGKVFVKHNALGTRQGVLNGPVNWIVQWTAPAAGSGTAYFYAAGNAADNDLVNSGDFIYNFASASAEGGSPHADVSLILQPDRTQVFAGTDLVLNARLSNHRSSPTTVFLGTRIRLPNGKKFPPNGFLSGPIPVNLQAGETVTIPLSHTIPANTPTLAAVYEGFIGTNGPKILIDSDRFDFRIP